MIFILALALGVAVTNVALARHWRLGAFSAPGWKRGAGHAAGFFARAALIFLTAHWVWLSRQQAHEVAVFIVAAAVLQLVGQSWLCLRDERRTT